MYTALRLRPEAAPRRSRRDRGRPAVLHDLPAVPARGRGRLLEPRHVVVPLRRVLKRLPRCSPAPYCRWTRSRRSPGSAARGAGYDLPVRPRDRRRRVGLADAADPGSRRARHRLQERRGSHPAAQPGASSAWTSPSRPPTSRSGGATSPSSSSAAGMPASRRWPSWRTWPATPPGTTGTCGPRTCAGCWSRRPRGSCPRSARTWAATPSSSCASGASRSGSRPGSSPCVDGHVVLSDGEEFDAADAGLDRRRQGRTRW